jgi:hypothetical protein
MAMADIDASASDFAIDVTLVQQLQHAAAAARKTIDITRYLPPRARACN